MIKAGDSPIYAGLPSEFKATRYHSLVVDNVGSPLVVDSVSKEDGEVMGLHHQEYRIFGVQFHPESVGTANGQKNILQLPQ